ncbi:ATP-NAD kinase family protein [Aestuariirhabdus litorea]|uniref:ATP-NAD kinase n=1 Tax=Aestuariirhabdus litorea TaxID=2528527 RepID=A0A3P3VSJ5_9GAMM|nr:ATP-NAD kinase family protein [Aestuariirhabdus litorea]RRJ84469.1 ATP-NAD kinase [Aestuariirhabdus litorea]RWW97693.1 ATP-NAD kinase [Endozoicomonadaceae bacterium GTF-13]
MTGSTRVFRLGLIINPLAGIGGAVGLKGSDGEAIVDKALAMGAVPHAADRTRHALSAILPLKAQVKLLTYPREMGESLAREMGFEVEVLGQIESGHTTAADTERAARELQQVGVDLILFAGGDGTARNICHSVGEMQPVLGVPAGVKIHSGVYAVTPLAAGEVVRQLIAGDLVTIAEAEVRDIDEEAFREGRVRARYYGDLLVPRAHQYLQRVKQGGREVEELVLQDIAAGLIEEMEPDAFYVVGPGTTTRGLMEEMGLDNTLLGVDLVRDQLLLAADATAEQLLELTEGGELYIVVTAIGGQGHIFGRGNHQISPELIRRAGIDHIRVIATKSKLAELGGAPLQVDTGEPDLDAALSGHIRVITGYKDAVLYPVGLGKG